MTADLTSLVHGVKRRWRRTQRVLSGRDMHVSDLADDDPVIAGGIFGNDDIGAVVERGVSFLATDGRFRTTDRRDRPPRTVRPRPTRPLARVAASRGHDRFSEISNRRHTSVWPEYVRGRKRFGRFAARDASELPGCWGSTPTPANVSTTRRFASARFLPTAPQPASSTASSRRAHPPPRDERSYCPGPLRGSTRVAPASGRS